MVHMEGRIRLDFGGTKALATFKSGAGDQIHHEHICHTYPRMCVFHISGRGKSGPLETRMQNRMKLYIYIYIERERDIHVCIKHIHIHIKKDQNAKQDEVVEDGDVASADGHL